MKIIVSLETKKSLDLAEKIKDYVDGFKINLINFEKSKTKKNQLVKKIRIKIIYGLSILEAISHLLCKKNMNLD